MSRCRYLISLERIGPTRMRPKHGMTAFLLAVISKTRTTKEWNDMDAAKIARLYRIPQAWVEAERTWQLGRGK